MSLLKIRQILLFAIVAFLFLGIGFRIGREKSVYKVTGESVKEVDTTVMNEVLARLKQYYLKPEDIEAKKLMYGAAEGMTASLGDPYTAFYPR